MTPRIDWRKVWREFKEWYENATWLPSQSIWHPNWHPNMQRKIRRLVEAQLKAKPKRKK